MISIECRVAGNIYSKYPHTQQEQEFLDKFVERVSNEVVRNDKALWQALVHSCPKSTWCDSLHRDDLDWGPGRERMAKELASQGKTR